MRRSGMSTPDKQAAFSDDKWDRALDLLVRRTCYGALGGAAVALLILRESDGWGGVQHLGALLLLCVCCTVTVRCDAQALLSYACTGGENCL